MEFKLCAGTWQWWVKDRETGKPLSPIQYVGTLIANETRVLVEIPDNLKDNPNAVIHIHRTR